MQTPGSFKTVHFPVFECVTALFIFFISSTLFLFSIRIIIAESSGIIDEISNETDYFNIIKIPNYFNGTESSMNMYDYFVIILESSYYTLASLLIIIISNIIIWFLFHKKCIK